MRMVLMAAAIVLALSATTTADAQSVTGKWSATFPMSIRNENGVFSADTGKAELIISEQKGDSIFGTWHALNTPVPSQARAISGTFKAGKIVFAGSPMTARIQRDGDSESVSMVTYFEGTMEADRIAGTMYSRSTDGSIESPPMNWSAKKAP